MSEKIEYIFRKTGEKKTENVPAGYVINWLYGSFTGGIALDLLIKRKFVSDFYGFLTDFPFSKKMIKKFCEEQGVKLDDFIIPKRGFRTFNDFFYRKIKPGKRQFPQDKNILPSPADGKIYAYEDVSEKKYYYLKGLRFSLDELTGEKLSDSYKKGSMLIIRLCPADYHRYHFPCSGKAGKSFKIKGDYYSVSPLSLRKKTALFCSNKREYCIIESPEFGNVIMMEVGATMVGGIVNTYKENSFVSRGTEKGYFKFGGSTLVLLFEENKIKIDKDLVENTAKGLETSVLAGESIGIKK